AVTGTPAAETDVFFVHRFDTESRDLEQRGHALELYERNGSYFVAASGVEGDRSADRSARTEVQVDKSWAVQILGGTMSPVTALERRLGSFEPAVVEEVRWIVGGRKLRRVDTQVGTNPPSFSLRGQARNIAY